MNTFRAAADIVRDLVADDGSFECVQRCRTHVCDPVRAGSSRLYARGDGVSKSVLVAGDLRVRPACQVKRSGSRSTGSQATPHSCGHCPLMSRLVARRTPGCAHSPLCVHACPSVFFTVWRQHGCAVSTSSPPAGLDVSSSRTGDGPWFRNPTRRFRAGRGH